MAFTDAQTKALKAKLSHSHVKTREQDGTTLSYVEGWHAIAEANRIFGFDSWDRQTIMPNCIWQTVQRGQTVCLYSAKVRVTVRAGDTVTTREGIGTGLGRSHAPEQAHEMALKVAETDATKRALATFGNPFGLALYDREKAAVTRPRNHAHSATLVTRPQAPLTLAMRGGKARNYETAEAFAAAALDEIAHLPTIDAVYAFWNANLQSLTELKRRGGSDGDPVESIIETMKARLRSISQAQAAAPTPNTSTLENGNGTIGTTSSLSPRPKEKRLRDKEHLAFVARQPCLVCGRKPSQAHHLKFAQPRAMAMNEPSSDHWQLPARGVHQQRRRPEQDQPGEVIRYIEHHAQDWRPRPTLTCCHSA